MAEAWGSKIKFVLCCCVDMMLASWQPYDSSALLFNYWSSIVGKAGIDAHVDFFQMQYFYDQLQHCERRSVNFHFKSRCITAW